MSPISQKLFGYKNNHCVLTYFYSRSAFVGHLNQLVTFLDFVFETIKRSGFKNESKVCVPLYH